MRMGLVFLAWMTSLSSLGHAQGAGHCRVEIQSGILPSELSSSKGAIHRILEREVPAGTDLHTVIGSLFAQGYEVVATGGNADFVLSKTEISRGRFHVLSADPGMPAVEREFVERRYSLEAKDQGRSVLNVSASDHLPVGETGQPGSVIPARALKKLSRRIKPCN